MKLYVAAKELMCCCRVGGQPLYKNSSTDDEDSYSDGTDGSNESEVATEDGEDEQILVNDPPQEHDLADGQNPKDKWRGISISFDAHEEALETKSLQQIDSCEERELNQGDQAKKDDARENEIQEVASRVEEVSDDDQNQIKEYTNDAEREVETNDEEAKEDEEDLKEEVEEIAKCPHTAAPDLTANTDDAELPCLDQTKVQGESKQESVHDIPGLAEDEVSNDIRAETTMKSEAADEGKDTNIVKSESEEGLNSKDDEVSGEEIKGSQGSDHEATIVAPQAERAEDCEQLTEVNLSTSDEKAAFNEQEEDTVSKNSSVEEIVEASLAAPQAEPTEDWKELSDIHLSTSNEKAATKDGEEDIESKTSTVEEIMGVSSNERVEGTEKNLVQPQAEKSMNTLEVTVEKSESTPDH